MPRRDGAGARGEASRDSGPAGGASVADGGPPEAPSLVERNDAPGTGAEIAARRARAARPLASNSAPPQPAGARTGREEAR